MELLKQRSLCPRRTDLPGFRLFAVSLSFWLIPAPVAWGIGSTAGSKTQCILNTLHALIEEGNLRTHEQEKLASEIAARRVRVPEFQFIREEALRRGLRVWLFGGTAAGYSHYVKWDILRELGETRYQPNRFDYDYTNIYRSTQDLDIVVSGNAKQAQQFEQALRTQFPYFLGSKTANWEVRSIREALADKGSLLGDFGFMNQHTDSNSTGMVELTDPPPGESVVLDIRDWNNKKTPAFLKDVTEGTLTFYHSPRHTETPRFKSGQNPPIFSVIRALTKAFQYDLKISEEDLAILQKEIDQFDIREDLKNPDAARWIEKNGKKLFQHAVNLEYAWDTLENLGLRKKLISIQNNRYKVDSLAWWMSKEPLRSKPVGEGSGQTAEQLGIKTIAHETKDFFAYENMTRAHTGTPNVFVSRKNIPGETAAYGEGFYSTVGKKGSRRTGMTIRFEVDPLAREGTDFILGYVAKGEKIAEGGDVIWINKNAIRVIPESLDLSSLDYIQFLADGKTIAPDDQALMIKMKRRLDQQIISARIPPEDIKEIRSIVLNQIKNHSPYQNAVIQEWLKIERARLKKNPQEIELLNKSFKMGTYEADPIPLFSSLTELSRGTDLETYITQEWLPTFLKSLKTDIGDTALEQSLASDNSQIREFGARVLSTRDAKNSTPFRRALKNIQAHGGDARAWLKSETESLDQMPEALREKAAYLALHPDLRQTLSEAELRLIGPEFDKISNLSVFEKLWELPIDAKAESFQFHSYDFPDGGKRVQLGSPFHEFGRWEGTENQYEVTFTKPFQMQVTPVTQLQWSIVMGDNPSHFKTGGKQITINNKDIEMNPNRPVEQVSWDDTQKFIQKLNAIDPQYNYRLPTEAEWEFAARGGTGTAYSYGDDPRELHAYGWYNANSDKETHDVAGLKPNPHGLYDIHGNVWEWVQDWWDNPRPDHSVDPTGPKSGSARVLHGGSWNVTQEALRSARRFVYIQGQRMNDIGFRLVRTPK